MSGEPAFRWRAHLSQGNRTPLILDPCPESAKGCWRAGGCCRRTAFF